MYAYFYTLGCKVNQYETEAIKSTFFEEGFQIVAETSQADIFVLNSCTVTQNADKKARQQLRRFRKINPHAVIVLLGCMPQAYPNIAEELPEADIVLGSVNKLSTVIHVKQFLKEDKKIVDITEHSQDTAFESMTVKNYTERTRAFVKIQDGCNRYCSYCIIPTSRGRLRSKPLEALKQELTDLAAAGYKEIVLVGINLCFYGVDLNLRLIDAIEAACQTQGIQRVRLGSLEPELIIREDAEKMASFEEFCPQFHLSLQHGSDSVLKAMNRHYSTGEYLGIVNMLKDVFPNPSFTTDFMVGFPGETEGDLETALAFLKTVGFSKIHVFSYSKRKSTKAACMKEQVDPKTKHKRSEKAIKTGKELQQAFFDSQLNTTAQILVEKEVDKHLYEGYSKNYTPVRLVSTNPISGEIVTAKLLSKTEEYAVGEVVE